MKKKIIIMVAVAVGSLAAIAQPYPTTNNIVRLTDQNMPAVEYYTLEKIKLPDKYVNAEYHVYNDDIVIIINYKNPQPYVVSFYSLSTKKEIAGYFRKGELVMATGDLRCNNLIVRDGVLHIASQLNIDSVLIYGYAYSPTVTQLSSGHSCVYVGENTITMTNPQYVNDGYGVEGLPEFVQYDAITGKPLADYKKNDKNYPSNLTQRSIAYCNSKYMVFWHNFPIITIYDKDFNLLKMYRDDKFKDLEVAKQGPQSMLFVNGLASFFTFSCQTDNYIFAHNGRWQVTEDEIKKRNSYEGTQSADFSMARFKNHEIWCFDNDMNLVRRFKCKNKLGFIRNVSYNEKSNILYINAKDANDEYCLSRCKFDQ